MDNRNTNNIVTCVCLIFLWASEGLQANPQSNRIEALIAQGQLHQALIVTDAQLAEDAGNVNLLFLKGLILTRQNELERARDIFVKLTQEHPELPEPYNNLAVVYAAQGDFTNARQALQQAINTHPSYATAHENLGDIYAKMASRAYNQALELDKDNETAREKLSLIGDLFSTKISEQEQLVKARQQEAAETSTEIARLEQELAALINQTKTERVKANQLQQELSSLQQKRDKSAKEARVLQANAEEHIKRAQEQVKLTREELTTLQQQRDKTIQEAKLSQADANEQVRQSQARARQAREELAKLERLTAESIKQAEQKQQLAREQTRIEQEKVEQLRRELAQLSETRDTTLAETRTKQQQAEEQVQQAIIKARQAEKELNILEQKRIQIIDQTKQEQQEVLKQVKQSQARFEQIREELARLEKERETVAKQVQLELAELQRARQPDNRATVTMAEEQPGYEEIIKSINQWAEFWSAKDVDGYLSHYSDEFKPAGNMSIEKWAVQRRQRIQKPRFITIEINDIRIKFIGDEHAQVSFEQKYRSDTYTDLVRKTLLMKYENERWLIAEEKTG